MRQRPASPCSSDSSLSDHSFPRSSSYSRAIWRGRPERPRSLTFSESSLSDFSNDDTSDSYLAVPLPPRSDFSKLSRYRSVSSFASFSSSSSLSSASSLLSLTSLDSLDTSVDSLGFPISPILPADCSRVHVARVAQPGLVSGESLNRRSRMTRNRSVPERSQLADSHQSSTSNCPAIYWQASNQHPTRSQNMSAVHNSYDDLPFDDTTILTSIKDHRLPRVTARLPPSAQLNSTNDPAELENILSSIKPSFKSIALEEGEEVVTVNSKFFGTNKEFLAYLKRGHVDDEENYAKISLAKTEKTTKSPKSGTPKAESKKRKKSEIKTSTPRSSAGFAIDAFQEKDPAQNAGQYNVDKSQSTVSSSSLKVHFSKEPPKKRSARLTTTIPVQSTRTLRHRVPLNNSLDSGLSSPKQSRSRKACANMQPVTANKTTQRSPLPSSERRRHNLLMQQNMVKDFIGANHCPIIGVSGEKELVKQARQRSCDGPRRCSISRSRGIKERRHTDVRGLVKPSFGRGKCIQDAAEHERVIRIDPCYLTNPHHAEELAIVSPDEFTKPITHQDSEQDGSRSPKIIGGEPSSLSIRRSSIKKPLFVSTGVAAEKGQILTPLEDLRPLDTTLGQLETSGMQIPPPVSQLRTLQVTPLTSPIYMNIQRPLTHTSCKMSEIEKVVFNGRLTSIFDVEKHVVEHLTKRIVLLKSGKEEQYSPAELDLMIPFHAERIKFNRESVKMDSKTMRAFVKDYAQQRIAKEPLVVIQHAYNVLLDLYDDVLGPDFVFLAAHKDQVMYPKYEKLLLLNEKF